MDNMSEEETKVQQLASDGFGVGHLWYPKPSQVWVLGEQPRAVVKKDKVGALKIFPDSNRGCLDIHCLVGGEKYTAFVRPSLIVRGLDVAVLRGALMFTVENGVGLMFDKLPPRVDRLERRGAITWLQ